MKNGFNFEEFSQKTIADLKQGKPLTGTEGIFTQLLKMILEASLQSEMQ